MSSDGGGLTVCKSVKCRVTIRVGRASLAKQILGSICSCVTDPHFALCQFTKMLNVRRSICFYFIFLHNSAYFDDCVKIYWIGWLPWTVECMYACMQGRPSSDGKKFGTPKNLNYDYNHLLGIQYKMQLKKV